MRPPEFLSRVAAFLLDLDGTFYLGERLLPGAQRFLDVLAGRGLDFLFLTNNSSRAPQDYRTKLARLGVDVPLEKIFTSGEATARYLMGRYPVLPSLALFGTPALEEQVRSFGFVLDDPAPQAVVLGFDKTLTYEKLCRLCDLVRAGLPFYATHPDFNCPVPGGFIPDTGAMLALVKASTGRDPDAVIGKPNCIMAEMAAARLGLPLESLAMVGDRLYTDVALGAAACIPSVLVLSGETRPADLEKSPHVPDLICADLDELAQALLDSPLTE